MYTQIINPITLNRFSIYSKKGQTLLNKYIQKGGHDFPCIYSTDIKGKGHCRKSRNRTINMSPECEINNNRCHLKKKGKSDGQKKNLVKTNLEQQTKLNEYRSNYTKHAQQIQKFLRIYWEKKLFEKTPVEKEVIKSKFEKEYDNTFWVSCHGICENNSYSESLPTVPEGCKLIFTTSIGRLGEENNYQKKAIFNDLQDKIPEQMVKYTNTDINSYESILKTALYKDLFWGRKDGTLFSDRVIYDTGDKYPDIHMLMNKDCFRQGIYLCPINEKIEYFMEDDKKEEYSINNILENNNVIMIKFITDKGKDDWQKVTVKIRNNKKFIKHNDAEYPFDEDENIWKFLTDYEKGKDDIEIDGHNFHEEENCYYNNAGADYYWKPKITYNKDTGYEEDKIYNTEDEKIALNNSTENYNDLNITTGWQSFMSSKLKNIVCQKNIDKNLIKKLKHSEAKKNDFVIGNGHSDSDKNPIERKGAQRKLSNVLNELTNLGIKGIFIITLYRPDETNEIDNDSILDNIKKIENKQLLKNYSDYIVYNKSKTKENPLTTPINCFLENLPHYKLDKSREIYKLNIYKLLKKKTIKDLKEFKKEIYAQSHQDIQYIYNNSEKIKEKDFWLENLIDLHLKSIIPPILDPIRCESLITDDKQCELTTRYSGLFYNKRDSKLNKASIDQEKQRRKMALEYLYKPWIDIAIDKIRIGSENKDIIQYALSKDIKLFDNDTSKNKTKDRLILEYLLSK